MEFLFAGGCFFTAIGVMVLVKLLGLGTELSIAFISPMFLLVIYSLAKIES